MSADTPAPLPEAVDTLIERCLRGDQTAWENVVGLYWRRVFNIVYKFVGKHEEAEDLAQDIFLKVFKSLDTFDRRANFQTWLTSVARNLCIDHYRSVRREREVLDRAVDPSHVPAASPTVEPTAALERRDRVALLARALNGLPARLREAVLMRDIQELSYQEIADALGVAEGTVKSRINRGRAELARHLRKLGEHDLARTGAR